MTRDNYYMRVGKRMFDLSVGSLFLVASLPIQAVVAGLVRGRIGTPVLFKQVRPGLHAEPFELIKFRSMTDERDPAGELLPDVERLTSLGRFLRSTSLDELPELVNVVRGDMSLVGPRPLLMRYLPRYSPEEYRRHEVRPGLTGLAQVKGRNNQTWESKFALDLEYVNGVSFTLDLRILVLTAWRVLLRQDVAAEGHATAPEFGLECREKAAQ